MNFEFQKNAESRQKILDLLDQNYHWPASYTFKFVIPTSSRIQFEALFPELDARLRFSANDKYVSYTFSVVLNSSLAVLEIYDRVKTIPGVISL